MYFNKKKIQKKFIKILKQYEEKMKVFKIFPIIRYAINN